jgi:hypothetical protein
MCIINYSFELLYIFTNLNSIYKRLNVSSIFECLSRRLVRYNKLPFPPKFEFKNEAGPHHNSKKVRRANRRAMRGSERELVPLVEWFWIQNEAGPTTTARR